ncbi:MAG: MBL fold metallo-hydrolase [bacterium]|nr:MBL fold metallo-hydrolase [bacterium]
MALVAALMVGLAACDGTAPDAGPASDDPAPAPRPAGGPVDGPRLRIVGTVQDGGLPHAACSCVRCEAARADPGRRRFVSSVAIVLPDPARVFLIDATPDIREQLDALRDLRGPLPGRVDRAPIDGVFLTHAHIGHYLGLAFFGFEAVHAQKLPVYCSAPLAGYLRDNGPWSQLVRIGNIELRESPAGSAIDLGQGVSVTPLSVPHRDEYADTVGFVIRGPRSTILYVPDTDSWRAWDPPATEQLRGIDVAIVDATFFSTAEMPGRAVESIGHPLIADSMDLFEPLVRDGKLQVYFTHLNHSNPALDPNGPEATEIRKRGFAVLEEKQELPL